MAIRLRWAQGSWRTPRSVRPWNPSTATVFLETLYSSPIPQRPWWRSPGPSAETEYSTDHCHSHMWVSCFALQLCGNLIAGAVWKPVDTRGVFTRVR